MVASAMSTGERRGVSTRRGGMTVLGKVTAPKPINLPSQRLENRGLDPNVEIVPKGTVSWGNTGRSPPGSGNAWGGSAFASSPPPNAGPWNNRLNVSTTRPSSGGSGTRPSTAGSDHSHEPGTPNAWGSTSSRPSSASGTLGLAHSQPATTRPCSAESRPGSSQLSRFAESSVESGGPWGGSGSAQKLGEGHPHPSQFSLTSVDFPTLGSEKNPNLRPQHGNASTMRSSSTSEGLAQKESLQPSPQDWCDDVSMGSSASKDQRSGDTWKLESPPYGGEMRGLDDRNPQKEGFQRQTFVHSKDSWHYDDGHRNPTASNPTVDEWPRGGPPVGPYGPPGGQGRFPFNPSGYIRPTFDYGPVPYPQRPHGPGGYNRHGEMYGPYAGQPMVAGRPSVPLGHSMYPNHLAFDGYYGSQGVPGSHYGNMDERGEMKMMRMGGGPGMYSGYQRHVDGPKFRHNGPGSGPRPIFHSSISRDQNDLSAYSRAASEGIDKAYVQQADIWVSKDANTSCDNNLPTFPQHSNARRTLINNPQSESDDLGSIPSSHRDWGTTSCDEQMDFSKPVFGEEALSSQGLAENNSGMESNHEKGADITMKSEQRSVSDKNKTQDQTKEGLEHPVKVDGSSKEEKKIVATLVDEKVKENVNVGELENQTREVYSTGRNHALSQEVQVLATLSKGLVITPSSDRHHALNTSLKLKGGLSSAAGLNNLSHETPKIKDRVQLLKRRENRPTDNSVDSEEMMEQVHSTLESKGIQEPVQRERNTMRGKSSAHEGDSEWRRKVPKVESGAKVEKNNILNSAHLNHQISASSVSDGSKLCSEDFGDKALGESQGLPPPGSHDFEAQRARMKEIAAQRAKQLQKEEEERTKEQKAKALAKLEELNRRASVCSTSQTVENSKSQSETLTSSGSVSSETFQKMEESLENKTLPQDNFGELKHNRKEDHKVKLGEQTDILKGPESITNNDVQCEVPSTLMSDESPWNIGKNVSDTPVKSGKNEKAKRENSRRPINVHMEDSKSYMKMDDQKSLPKERRSPSYIDSQQDCTRDAPVASSLQTSLSTSESFQKGASLTESDSSQAPDQQYNLEFTKQNRNRQKAKQYVLEQKSSSSHLSTSEKTEQVMSIDTSRSVNPAGENDMLQESSNTTSERISETCASSSDCIPVSRKKKTNRSTKSKHKSDRPIVTGCSELPEQDDSMATQLNRVAADLKQESVEVSGNSLECVDKYVDIQNRKSELSSAGNVGSDVNMATDAPAVDRGLLQSTEDTYNGRVPQVKSHFSKRTYRGSQEGRVDKSHGSEGMVWAPVRAVNHQVSANYRQKLDQIGGELEPSGSMSSEVPVQNPVRNRRAELERYVPKPVAKEQAQHQENRQHHVSGSIGSVRDQMDHRNTQQGTSKNLVSGEARQKNLSTGESIAHTVGIKQGKPNASWRQRNSNEVRESKVSQCIEVETAFSLQTNEVTVSKTRQGHLQTQDMKSEDIGDHPQLQQLESHKARQLEQLPKSVPAQANRQQSSHSEADQAPQLAPMHHLHTSDAAKDHAAQMSCKREQNERFYQANKSRQKLHKISVRQGHMEGNHQITKIGVSGESDKKHSELIISHQRPRSSGSWTPKQHGLADQNEHPMNQKTISLGETDIHHGNMDSCEEKHNFQSQLVHQSVLPSHVRTLSDQQDGVQSSAKQQHAQDQYFGQIPGSPHQSEGKYQVPNPRQAASTSYQHRRQSGHGHWQQTGSRTGSRRTESQEEHTWPPAAQNRVRQDTRPSTPESSFGAGQHNRQDMIKQQASANSDPIKQTIPVHSHQISNQKPQELYQPKSASASWTGDKNGINQGSASHGGSFWSGEHRNNHVYRDRDHNHARRGRTGGRGGRGFGVGGHEAESKTEHPSKQRMLVDATGGAVPRQVAG